MARLARLAYSRACHFKRTHYPFAAKGLYLALRGHAPRHIPVDDAFRLDGAGRSVQKTLDVLGAQALETWDRTVGVTTERDALARENEAQDATIGVLCAEQNRLANACHELALREERLLQSMARLESDLRSVTLERDDQARESEAALHALEEIHASCAWRLVMFSRHLSAGLLPAGTRRRRVFNAVLRRIAQRADVDLRTA